MSAGIGMPFDLGSLDEQGPDEEEQAAAGQPGAAAIGEIEETEGAGTTTGAETPEQELARLRALATEHETLKGRYANLEQKLGQQGDQLGRYRQMFEPAAPAGPTATPPGPGPAYPGTGYPPPGMPGGYGPAAFTMPTVSPLEQAMNAARMEFGQTGDENLFYRRLAAAQEAEVDRRIREQIGQTVSGYQSQAQQMAAFEAFFWEQHPELKEGYARRIFDMALVQARSSGMFRNPVDMAEAAAGASTKLLTEMGYEFAESETAAEKVAKALHQAGPRGARPGSPAAPQSQADVQKQLNADYLASEKKRIASQKRPSARRRS